MRIIGGQYRGRKLAEFPGEEVRPTGDRVKESLFNILTPRLYGARVLDLFSGSGALGLESLSRGAEKVVFNDAAKSSLDIVRKNLALVKPDGEKYKVLNLDYSLCLRTVKGPFDIIFVDPPYRMEIGAECLRLIGENGLLSRGGVVVYERDGTYGEIPEGWTLSDERHYGRTKLYFFGRSDDE